MVVTGVARCFATSGHTYGLCSLAFQHFNFFFNTAFKPVFFPLEIITGLKVKPEALRKTEIARKSECCISSDRPFSMHYFVDTTGGHVDVFGKPVLGNIQRF